MNQGSSQQTSNYDGDNVDLYEDGQIDLAEFINDWLWA